MKRKISIMIIAIAILLIFSFALVGCVKIYDVLDKITEDNANFTLTIRTNTLDNSILDVQIFSNDKSTYTKIQGNNVIASYNGFFEKDAKVYSFVAEKSADGTIKMTQKDEVSKEDMLNKKRSLIKPFAKTNFEKYFTVAKGGKNFINPELYVEYFNNILKMPGAEDITELPADTLKYLKRLHIAFDDNEVKLLSGILDAKLLDADEAVDETQTELRVFDIGKTKLIDFSLMEVASVN